MSKGNGKSDIVRLPVADLKMKYDVRRALNEDRVLFFMELYDSGAEVAPIEVIRGTMDIHDGRHRKAALDHLDIKSVECKLVKAMDHGDQLMDAFSKNMSDSPMPPTRADVVFVMRQLLEAGESHSTVQRRFERFYQPSHAKKLLKDAHSCVQKAKMARAKNAVAHQGMKVDDAAKEYGVKVETLREEITGTKQRRRKAGSVSDIKNEITSRHRSNSQKTVALFRDILEKFEDGEKTEKEVYEVLLHVQKINSDAAKRVNSWIERFETLRGKVKAKA